MTLIRMYNNCENIIDIFRYIFRLYVVTLSSVAIDNSNVIKVSAAVKTVKYINIRRRCFKTVRFISVIYKI